MQKYEVLGRLCVGGGGLMMIACMLCLVMAVSVHGETVTLQPLKDNTLFENPQGDTSNGAGEAVFAGRTGNFAGGTRQRAVMAFDVAGSIPAGSTINNVTLTLVLVQSASGNQPCTVHRMLGDWGEGTSTAFGGQGAAATANDATWLHQFFPNEFWSQPGGEFVAMASASQTVSGVVGPFQWSSAQMTADVQAWLDDPCANFGWMIRGNESQTMTSKKFASKDSKIETDRPALLIDYTPGVACSGDIAGNDEVVNVDDLLAVIGAWGQCSVACCPADVAGNDGVVNVDDLLAVIGTWGPCP